MELKNKGETPNILQHLEFKITILNPLKLKKNSKRERYLFQCRRVSAEVIFVSLALLYLTITASITTCLHKKKKKNKSPK